MNAKQLLLTLGFLFCLPAHGAITLNESGNNKNYLFERDASALASSVQLVFRTGSSMDPKGKEGLSSLAFEALLRGTKSKERKDFFAAVERLGATMSVDTGSNRTIITLDSVSENLEESLGLLAEAVLQPALKDSEIKLLIDERLSQLHQELSSNKAVMKRVFRQAVFRGTTLAISADGNPESVKAITPEDVRSFLSAQLKSGNAVVAVMSNHSQNEVKGWVEKAFKAMPEGNSPSLPSPALQAPVGRTLFLIDRKGASTTEVAIGHLGIEAARPDRQTLELAQFILGGDMSARLFQTLRGKNGWTYGAYSSYSLIDIPRRFGGSFMIYTYPQSEHTEKAVLKAIELYEDYAINGPTSEELKFAKDSLMNSYPFKFATSKSRLTARLYEHLDGAPLLSVASYRKIVGAVTTKSVLAALKKAHNPANLVIVLVGDPDQTAALKKTIPGITEVIQVTDPMKAL